MIYTVLMHYTSMEPFPLFIPPIVHNGNEERDLEGFSSSVSNSKSIYFMRRAAKKNHSDCIFDTINT